MFYNWYNYLRLEIKQKKRVKMRIRFLFLFIFYALLGYSQENKPQVSGLFLYDSVKIGEPTPFILTCLHPPNDQLLFPDSTYIFGAFEYEKKIFFPSRWKGNYIFDSCIYYLSHFDIVAYQTLSIPVFEIINVDTLFYYSAKDSIFTAGLLKSLPQNPALKSTVFFNPLSLFFNYPYFFIGIVCFCILITFLWIMYGKKVIKFIKIYRLRKKYEIFSNALENKISTLRSNPTRSDVEDAYIVWKKYLQNLENIPYTILTTKEILKRYPSERLQISLQNIDRMVYGRLPNNEIYKSIEILEDITLEKYLQKIESIKNEK